MSVAVLYLLAHARITKLHAVAGIISLVITIAFIIASWCLSSFSMTHPRPVIVQTISYPFTSSSFNLTCSPTCDFGQSTPPTLIDPAETWVALSPYPLAYTSIAICRLPGNKKPLSSLKEKLTDNSYTVKMDQTLYVDSLFFIHFSFRLSSSLFLFLPV